MKQITLSLLLVSSFFFFGCEKEYSYEKTSTEASTPLINEKAIIRKWKFVSITDANNVSYTNSLPCLADNTLDYRADHTGTLSQGDCIDNPNAPQNEDFTWFFKTADIVNMGGDEIKIVELTDSTLHFTRVPDPSNLTNYDYRWKR